MNTLDKFIKPDRSFYLDDTLFIAKSLIGKLLVSSTPEGITAGRIVETEAYLGPRDKAAHAYKKSLSGRTNILYTQGGYAYVYLIYGMYCCMNVSTGKAGVPECVLIRALEPVIGFDIMAKRRKTDKLKSLCSGPGKLCQALSIDRTLYGADLCGDKLFIAESSEAPPAVITSTPRINIPYAEEDILKPWRFVDASSPFLSIKIK